MFVITLKDDEKVYYENSERYNIKEFCELLSGMNSGFIVALNNRRIYIDDIRFVTEQK